MNLIKFIQCISFQRIPAHFKYDVLNPTAPVYSVLKKTKILARLLLQGMI